MKIKVYDIKVNNRSFTEADIIRMYVPAASEHEKMIGWLEEFSKQPYTADAALAIFIRTNLLYCNKIDYKMQFVFDDSIQKSATEEFIIADMIDCEYEFYKHAAVKLQLPEYIVVDTADLMYPEYDDEIEQLVFELLLNSLKLTIHEVVC